MIFKLAIAFTIVVLVLQVFDAWAHEPNAVVLIVLAFAYFIVVMNNWSILYDE